MTPGADHYRNRLLALIAAILSVAALKLSYPVTMPLMFAAVVVAALWPLKRWFGRVLPSWLSYALTILVFLVVLAGFAAAIALSVAQVVGVLGDRASDLERAYSGAVRWADRQGVSLTGGPDQARVFALAQAFAMRAYSALSYTGFIGLLVILGMPEVHRLGRKLRERVDAGAREDVNDAVESISEQVRRYLATTLATSVLTGVASFVWALVTGLDLALVWGLSNFLLNFIPVIGNIVGIIPPTLYALVQFDGWTTPLVIFAGFAVLQIVISNFVYPLLQGQSLSLSPLAIILALTFWGWAWGLAGALIAVPLTAAMVIVSRHFDRTRWFATLVTTGP